MICYFPYLSGISTSDTITRVVKDYDIYARRNLARGYTPGELNIPFVTSNRYRLEKVTSTVKFTLNYPKKPLRVIILKM